MSLLKSASTIASSSVVSQLIGALSIWLISHKYNMAEVGLYALNYSIAVVGAQVCTFASQLLIPKQQDDELAQNVVFCLLQSALIALPYAVLTAWLFHQNILFLYLGVNIGNLIAADSQLLFSNLSAYFCLRGGGALGTAHAPGTDILLVVGLRHDIADH